MLPAPLAATLQFGLLVLAGVVASSLWADYPIDLTLMGALAAASVAGDLFAPRLARRGALKVSGSFIALVLAMVFLGPPAAALIGVATILAGWARSREAGSDLRANLVTFAWFPLLGALAFDWARDATGARPDQALFYILVAGTFVLGNVLNLAFIGPGFDRAAWADLWRRVLVPSFTSQAASAVLAVGIAFFYVQLGLVAIPMVAVVLVTFLYLLAKLLVSEDRAEELGRRTEQLASLQVGLLSALLRTLDLRDRMTARHSAAVARYAREIAAAAGMSEEEQELAHTAGLLHDIGKFTFPDHILKADQRLTDDDWKIIRTHPYQGAKIVSQVEGYGPVGGIIVGHHERYDGKGYPRGIAGEDIPAISRIISVADVYDVITARDSYRTPVSSFEAIQELRRVAGRQLDPRFVEIFVELLAGRDLRYRHGEDADFETELSLEKRVHAYASPGAAGAFASAAPAATFAAGGSAADARAEDADGSGPLEGGSARERVRASTRRNSA